MACQDMITICPRCKTAGSGIGCGGRKGGAGREPRRFLLVCFDCLTDDEEKGKAKPAEYQGFEDEQKPKPTSDAEWREHNKALEAGNDETR